MSAARVLRVFSASIWDVSMSEADAISDARNAAGERAMVCHWFEQRDVFVFENMTEPEIQAWIDAEWERLHALELADFERRK